MRYGEFVWVLAALAFAVAAAASAVLNVWGNG